MSTMRRRGEVGREGGLLLPRASKRQRALKAGVDLCHHPIRHSPNALLERITIDGCDLSDVDD